MMIEFRDFSMNRSAVAPVIYGNSPHYTTNTGIELGEKVVKELRDFLKNFNLFMGVTKTAYYRMDAYFDENNLNILEINASFVDGWGTALNLARACDIAVDSRPLLFPKLFVNEDQVYMPEFELFKKELEIIGHETMHEQMDHLTPTVYYYGRWAEAQHEGIFPYDGIRIDNKLNLAMFGLAWKGDRVRIPKHYMRCLESWENIPDDVVLKFCDKGGEECQAARQSVIFNKPTGKAKFIKRCYEENALIAQEIIQPTKRGDNNCQLVILAINENPVTGYVQYSPKKIINDNSMHGPLRMIF
jgi:hypothetical protein